MGRQSVEFICPISAFFFQKTGAAADVLDASVSYNRVCVHFWTRFRLDAAPLSQLDGGLFIFLGPPGMDEQDGW